MDKVQQGETYHFTFEISGDDTLSCSISVLQYPGDTAAITRTITSVDGEFEGVLTSAETAALDVGQWFIHARLTDSDEDIRKPIKIYVTKGWV